MNCLQAILGFTVATLIVSPALADDVADFYRGRTISLYVGYPPPGGYDVYARLIARHMGRYIPGNPQFIVRNKPGAGSLNLVNELYNVLPRDGSAFATFARSMAMDRVLGRDGTHFNPVKMNWIGSANNEVTICTVWHTLGIHSTEAFMSRPIIFGANAPGSESDVYPNMLNTLFGTKFKVVTGYPGINDLSLAMERGETEGRCGWTWATAKAAKPDWIRDKKVYIGVQIATAKHPELPDVPLVTDFAKTDQQRAVLDLILTQQVMGRPYAAPPDVPPERIAALRRAFTQTMKDTEFLAEAGNMRLEIAPVDGQALQNLVERMVNAAPAVIEAARKAIGQR